MSKSFRPEPGYMARRGAFWYDHRVLLTVEDDARIEIFRRPCGGKPGGHIGIYRCTELDPQNPPTGLRTAKPAENNDSDAAAVALRG